MTKILCSLFLIVISSCTFATANKWCNVQCHMSPAPHVLCDLSPDVVSRNCGTPVQTGLTQQEVQKVLNAHNSLRQRVASGQERQGRPGPQPPAKYMPNLVWDNQLAQMAQAWANQCDTGNHRCSHLSSSYSDQIGQNLAWSGSLAEYEELVHNWYKEVAIFNKNEVKSMVFRPGPPWIGHYTQLVWAKTTKVGCGGIKYIANGEQNTYLVCNYGPAGNFPGAAVYETD